MTAWILCQVRSAFRPKQNCARGFSSADPQQLAETNSITTGRLPIGSVLRNVFCNDLEISWQSHTNLDIMLHRTVWLNYWPRYWKEFRGAEMTLKLPWKNSHLLTLAKSEKLGQTSVSTDQCHKRYRAYCRLTRNWVVALITTPDCKFTFLYRQTRCWHEWL